MKGNEERATVISSFLVFKASCFVPCFHLHAVKPLWEAKDCKAHLKWAIIIPCKSFSFNSMLSWGVGGYYTREVKIPSFEILKGRWDETLKTELEETILPLHPREGLSSKSGTLRTPQIPVTPAVSTSFPSNPVTEYPQSFMSFRGAISSTHPDTLWIQTPLFVRHACPHKTVPASFPRGLFSSFHGFTLMADFWSFHYPAAVLALSPHARHFALLCPERCRIYSEFG